jgi:hypothetical protein
METWTRLIGTSVVPVVVISATGLLCLAFYNRLAAIVSRVRTFQRERLQQQELRDKSVAAKDSEAVIRHERIIDLLSEQTEHVTQRARLIRLTLLLFLCAIAALILCSLFCGVTAIQPRFIYAAVFSFGIGLGLLLAGVVCAIREMWISLAPVELESEVVALLAP